MARMYVVLDDVLASLKSGKKVTADRKGRFAIPYYISETGARRVIEVDLSIEGQEMLKKEIRDKDKKIAEAKLWKEEALAEVEEKFLERQKDAWARLVKVANHAAPPRVRKKKKKKEDESPELEQETPTAKETETQETEEAVTPDTTKNQVPQQENTETPATPEQPTQEATSTPSTTSSFHTGIPKPGGLGIPRPGFNS